MSDETVPDVEPLAWTTPDAVSMYRAAARRYEVRLDQGRRRGVFVLVRWLGTRPDGTARCDARVVNVHGHTFTVPVSAIVAVRAAAPKSTVHRCPPPDGGLTPCCQRTPFEIPRGDRMTLNHYQVTCTGAPE